MGMSDYLELQVINHMLRTTPWTRPTTIAISLHVSDPGDTTAGAAASEVANANGYARATRAQGDANWAAPGTTGLSDNTGVITFNAPTGSGWGTVGWVGLWDNAGYGLGNFLMGAPLVTAKTINGGDAAPTFPTGTFDVVFT